MDEQRQASTSSADQIRAERAGIQPTLQPQGLPESGDLHATLPLSQQEARRGTSCAIRLPGGRQTSVIVPAGAYEGQVIALEGLGEPAFPGGPRGRLTLTLTITPADYCPNCGHWHHEEVDVAPAKLLTMGNLTTDRTNTSDEQVAYSEASENLPTEPVAEAVPTREKRTAQYFPRLTQSRALHLIGLVLLLALAVMGSMNRLALTQHAASTPVPLVRSADTPLATRTAQATARAATATAQRQVTPSPTQAAVATAIPAPGTPYPPANAILALDDPLRQSSSPSNGNLGEGCWFAGDGYHVRISVPLWTYFCNASATRFSNVAYEVHMRLVKGNAGGLILRANAMSATFYYFRIDQRGHYQLLIHAGSTPAVILVQGRSSSFQTGPGQSNLLAVVATGDEMTLYVNHTFTTKVRDGTYSQGQIGVAATADERPLEVVFSQARVWEF